ncbi:MAG: hypothetical protein FJZ96_08050, partial [Chloroflexi bacterium]|nr:hypothetical protein [Chloroflexota bacterium]
MPYPYEPISRLKNYRRRPRGIFIIGGLLASIALLVGLYYVPPIHERLTWRLADLRTRIVYWLNPPDEVIFLPTQQSQVDLMVTQTLAAMQTPTATPIPPSGPTPTPTITPTPLPLSISLAGVVYVDQHNRWNYCGPANLTMALKFWGWEGTRDDVAKVVKPGIQ